LYLALGIAGASALSTPAAASATAPSSPPPSVFVANANFIPGRVYSLARASDGSISLRAPAFTQTTNSSTERVAVTPDGSHVYAINADTPGSLDQFSVDASGQLSALNPEIVSTNATPGSVVVSPNGHSAYLAGGNPCCTVEEFNVEADGTLTHKSTPQIASDGRFDMVMTPDGRNLYVSSFGSSGIIDHFDVAANGTLSAAVPATTIAGEFPVGMAIAPDGRSLYVGLDASPSAVAQFTIGPGGALAAKNPASVPLPASTADPIALAASPNGKNLYVGDETDGGIDQFTIASDGTISALSPATVGTLHVDGLAVSPDGDNVYATSQTDGNTTRYTVNFGGALQSTGNLAATGIGSDGIAVTPDLAPVAALKVTPGPPKHRTRFNAAASFAPNGNIVRYQWSFGDGTTDVTATPKDSHVYARRRVYTVRLTVTDTAGTSTARVFTGHQMLLNGGATATLTRKLLVGARPKLSKLTIAPARFRAGPGHGKGTQVAFHLDIAAAVLVRVQRVKGHHRVLLAGVRRLKGHGHENRFRFSGLWNGKALPRGGYRLLLTAALGPFAGGRESARFTILK
jgi:6-phosphogluconolactonase (cycloisomerase 2 family)